MSKFRTTLSTPTISIGVWPNRELISPPLVAPYTARALGCGIEIFRDSGRSARPIPEELYLRGLFSLDLEGADAVAEFIGKYGMMEASEGSHLVGVLGYDPDDALADHTDPRLEWVDCNDLLNAQFDSSDDYLVEHEKSAGTAIPLVRFGYLARNVRDMTRVWQCNVGFITFHDVSSAWESPQWFEENGRPESLEQAMTWLVWTLNDALAPVSTRVSTGPAGRPVVDLYAALAVQLFNQMVSLHPFRRCQLDDCKAVFVQQAGRKAKGQARAGAMYCDYRHARKAEKRQMRADQKRALQMHAEGDKVGPIARSLHRRPETIRKWLDVLRPPRDAGGGSESNRSKENS